MSSIRDGSLDPLLSEEYQAHPERVLAELRDSDPVHWVPGIDAWFVTRHELVRQLFTSQDVSTDRRLWDRYEAPAEGSFTRWVADNAVHFPTLSFGEYIEDSPRTRAEKMDGTRIPVTIHVDKNVAHDWGIRPK